MKYKVTISEIKDADAELIYEQIVQELDIRVVVDAVNSWAAPAKKTRAARSDKGKKRVEPIAAAA